MQSTSSRDAAICRGPVGNASPHDGVFVVVALLLLAFCLLLFAAIVIHIAYPMPPTELRSIPRLESIWAWLVTGGLAWAIVNLLWAMQAASRRSARGFYVHFAITTCCGLLVTGIQGVIFARAFALRPQVLDYSRTVTSAGETPAVTEPDAASAGDPEQGRQLFASGCATCHGPTGGGMANLAPSLVGSEFAASADDSAVAGVIRNGRPVGHPQNKSGKPMPARGGNPFLQEDQIAHLVAFVRAIQDGGPVAAEGDTESIELARWVVPAPAAPPSGIDLRAVAEEQRAGHAVGPRLAERRGRLLHNLTLAMTGVHSLFLWGVVILAACLAAPRLIAGQTSKYWSLWPVARAGWLIAALAWLPIAVVCFWWS